MKDPLGVSPSKGKQGTTRGEEKIILISVGIASMTSGLLCPLSYEVGQRKSSGSFIGFSQHFNLHFRVNPLFHHVCSWCYAAQHSYVPLLSLRRDSPPKSSPTFSVRPRSSVGRVTVDLLRRLWVRFPPRSKEFFLYLVWFPVSLYNG